MPRLIDANEFRKRIDHYPPDIRDIAKKELRYTPTVDAVEVVRCRYCRGWNRENGYCVDFLVTDPNGYCSFGERRE